MYILRHIGGFIFMIIIVIALLYIFTFALSYTYTVATNAWAITSNALGYGVDSNAYSLYSTYGHAWGYLIDALLIGIVIAGFIGAARRRQT